MPVVYTIIIFVLVYLFCFSLNFQNSLRRRCVKVNYTHQWDRMFVYTGSWFSPCPSLLHSFCFIYSLDDIGMCANSKPQEIWIFSSLLKTFKNYVWRKTDTSSCFLDWNNCYKILWKCVGHVQILFCLYFCQLAGSTLKSIQGIMIFCGKLKEWAIGTRENLLPAYCIEKVSYP